MRIVYVEDNLANVHLVKRVARMGQHEVINYIDGTDALNRFALDDPDLVLMDIQLAGELTGLQVVKEIRERGFTTPIIAVTAYAMVGDRERCIEAGCNGYMSKPIPVMELVEMFNQYTAPKAKDVEAAEVKTPEAKVDEPVVEKTPEAKVTSPVVEKPVAETEDVNKTLSLKPDLSAVIAKANEETPTLVSKPESSDDNKAVDDVPPTEPSLTQKQDKDETQSSFPTKVSVSEQSAEGADKLSDDKSESASLKSDGDNDDLPIQSEELEEKKRTAEIE